MMRTIIRVSARRMPLGDPQGLQAKGSGFIYLQKQLPEIQ